MSRATVIINGKADREKISRWAYGVPLGTRVEFKEVKRSLPQNDRMWAMLTDVAQQATLGGKRYTPDKWKVIFLDALGHEMELLPSLDGTRIVPFGQSSSDLSKQEMSDLIELIFKFGAEHGVTFQDEKAAA